MKKLIFISFSALLFLSGCGSKSVEQDLTKKEETNKPQPVDQKLNKVVLIDDSVKPAEEEVVVKELDFANDIKSIYFAYDKYVITDKMQDIALDNYKLIKENSVQKIKLEGNCDEWGSDEYNYALGLKRAKATKDAMVAYGLDENLFTLVSLGESNPQCSEHTQECWAKNRRVDYKKIDE
jgi:peptidoglycan-associated lipoprotein